MGYNNLSTADRSKIVTVSLYAKEHNIVIEYANIDYIKIAICNEGITENAARVWEWYNTVCLWLRRVVVSAP